MLSVQILMIQPQHHPINHLLNRLCRSQVLQTFPVEPSVSLHDCLWYILQRNQWMKRCTMSWPPLVSINRCDSLMKRASSSLDLPLVLSYRHTICGKAKVTRNRFTVTLSFDPCLSVCYISYTWNDMR